MATSKKQEEATSTGTEVDTVKQQQLAAVNAMFAEDSGAGFEEADASAFAIPFIQILQSGSPQCKKSDGAYIKGAEEGMFYNTVTQDLYSGEEGLLVVPAHYSNRFIEWQPRENGGGFVAEHMPGETAPTVKDENNRDILPNGNTLVDTRNHYVLFQDKNGDWQPALVAMSSTQLKKSRQWMSKMQGIKIKRPDGSSVVAPMASRVWRLTTVPEKNDKGSWFGFRMEIDSIVTDPTLYQAAKDFAAAVKSGKKKANFEQAAASAAGDTTGDEQF